MDTAESREQSSYAGSLDPNGSLYPGSINPGGYYSHMPNVHPGNDRASDEALPAVGSTVKHVKSGETGVVTGHAPIAHTGERLPTVRWNGVPGGAGSVFDQGYSLDALTTP